MRLERIRKLKSGPAALTPSQIYIGSGCLRDDLERTALANPFRAYRPLKSETLETCWMFDDWLRGNRRTPRGYHRQQTIDAISDLPHDAELVCNCGRNAHCHGLWIIHWWYELNNVVPEEALTDLPRRTRRRPIQATLFDVATLESD